jgi:hypothetical protein
VLSILDDLKPVFEVLTPSGGAWARARITGLPDLGTARPSHRLWRIRHLDGGLLQPRHR